MALAAAAGAALMPLAPNLSRNLTTKRASGEPLIERNFDGNENEVIIWSVEKKAETKNPPIEKQPEAGNF